MVRMQEIKYALNLSIYLYYLLYHGIWLYVNSAALVWTLNTLVILSLPYRITTVDILLRPFQHWLPYKRHCLQESYVMSIISDFSQTLPNTNAGQYQYDSDPLLYFRIQYKTIPLFFSRN
jgi:hypothetical protein